MFQVTKEFGGLLRTAGDPCGGHARPVQICEQREGVGPERLLRRTRNLAGDLRQAWIVDASGGLPGGVALDPRLVDAREIHRLNAAAVEEGAAARELEVDGIIRRGAIELFARQRRPVVGE